MFLFTTPSPSSAPAPVNPVVEAIRNGAEKSGTEFDYLLATAQRESALDPKAHAPGSSATGLFQFIEQTWLGLVKTEGPKIGLGDQAAAISARPDGGFAVGDPASREAILGMREDPKVASVLAGALTQRNRDVLAGELGREPSRADLYIAHFLGARGASDLIRTAQTSPTRPAATDFPEAAAANRSIFYDRGGQPRGAGEVYARLAQGQLAGPAAVSAPAPSNRPALVPEKAIAFAPTDGPAFHGLFQTEARRGPMSDAVARLWRGGEGRPSARAPSFFPRSGEPDATADEARTASIEARPETAVPIVPTAPSVDADGGMALPPSVPLPPTRPADLGRASRAAYRRNAPLDLSAFTRRRGA